MSVFLGQESICPSDEFFSTYRDRMQSRFIEEDQNDLDALFEVLAAGTTIESTATTSKVCEPDLPKLEIEIVTLRTWEERSRDLIVYKKCHYDDPHCFPETIPAHDVLIHLASNRFKVD